MNKKTLLWILLGISVTALLATGGAIVVANWKRSYNAQKYLPLLNATEDKYGIPRDLLARLAYQESRFRSDIISGEVGSSAGAQGIMQIVPKFHPDVNPLNIPEAIDYAGKFLKGLYIQFKDWRLAVAAYNAGPGNVSKYNGIPPFDETKNYVTQIFADVPTANA